MKRSLLVLAASALVLAACGKSSGGGGGGGNTSGSNTQDIMQVVSTGMSLSYNDLTGGANDIAVNPVTHLPAIAYHDKNAPVSGTTAVGALKYAAMQSNGSWTIEVVDANYGTVACGTALSYCVGAPNAAAGQNISIIKMAFTSAGTPVIAYVFGASANTVGGFKQVRYAERIGTTQSPWVTSVAYSSSTAAVATNVVVATSDPIKGLALALDSKNRPHLSFNFYTQTATSSTTRYAFRANTGVWTVNDIFATHDTSALVVAAGAGGNQNGMAICPSTGMPFVTGTQVTGAGTSIPYLHYCNTLSATTGACTAWTNVPLLTGCSAGACFSTALGANSGVRADITYNSTDGKMFLGYYSVTSTNTLVGELPVTCGTALPTAAGSYGALTTPGLAAGTAGLNGFRLATAGTKLLAAYINTTTSMMYNVFSSGAWLATGNIVDSVAGAAFASEGVGLAYDATNDVMYSSYALLPAAAAGAFGNDIKVGAAQPGDLVNAGANGTLYNSTVDTTVTLFPSAAIPMVTAAKAANGTVGYSYFYQDSTATNDRLYYGVRTGTTTNPSFSQNLVTNAVITAGATLVGSYPSLTYDSNSNPFIAFYDGLATDQMLYVATSPNGGDYWSLTQVDKVSTNVGTFPAMANFGTAVGVAYYDITNKGLKFARYTPGVGWKRYAVDGGGSAAACNNVLEDDGQWAALRFTSTGAPVIAYQSNGVNLKIAYATQAVTGTTFTWTCVTVDASAALRGAGIDLQLNSSDVPYIAHFDGTAGTVRLVKCANAIGTCISAGPTAFSGAIVDGSGITSTTVTKPSVQVGSDGTVYVAFYSASFQGMTLASQAPGATKWTIEHIDASNSGASYISAAGQYVQLLLNSSGNPMAFYRSNENWLKYFSREPL